MNRFIFFVVILLSLGYAVLNLVDTWMDQTYDRALLEQKAIQFHLANAQRIHTGGQELLRTMAIESEHDPAIWEILKKNKIKVTFPAGVTNPDGTAAPATTSSPAPTPSSQP